MATASSSIGHMDPYDDSSETFEHYLERFDMFSLANSITDEDKKKATFLSLIGPKTYSLLRSLTTPDKPKDKGFADLTTLLQDHLSPAPLEIAETYRFHQRNQLPGENTNQFIAQLRALSTHCNFHADHRARVLRDRFVCGISSDSTRRKLLSEANLTLARALEIARSMEQADKDLQSMTAKPYLQPTTAVSALNSQTAEVAALNTGTAPQRKSCRSCGSTQHLRRDCPHLSSECFKCGLKGHLQTVCERTAGSSNPRSKQQFGKRQNKAATHSLGTSSTENNNEESEELAHINSVSAAKVPAIMLDTSINGHNVKMELDTGASVSTIPLSVYKRVCPGQELESTNVTLKPYGVNNRITPKGRLSTNLQYLDQKAQVSMFVIGEDDEVPLFGRDMLRHFTLDWPEIKRQTHLISAIQTQDDSMMKTLTQKFPELFSDSLGEFKGFKARINLRDDTVPTYHKYRTVPFAMRSKVEDEIAELLREKIISPVEHSEWATPVVPVIKPSGKIRLCGDFKVTLNPHLATDTYPMPSVDDLQEKMSGGTLFSKLDLSRAFAQIKLAEESKKYVTITTHLGLFQFNRLPYGTSTAPAIHQRAMDRILRDIPSVMCYQDDIFITGKDYDDHHQTLMTVLQRLQDHGLRVNKDKCSFLQNSIIYLGHRIDKFGLHPTESKVKAVKEAPTPRNVSELRSFLGLINYYQKFLPSLSSALHPLHRLTTKGAPWEWSRQCEDAFNKVKALLSTDRVLVPYDSKLPVSLACDASSYGLGAVLSHVMPNGEERPIAFASRTLSDSEKNYAQIEREALSLIFGVTKFHIYLYGRSFTLITDHRPLTTILGPKANIPSIAAMRMQRWAAILAAYTYDIRYKSSETHSNADAMSRLPQTCNRIHCNQLSLFHMQHFGDLPVTTSEVREQTNADSLLSTVYKYTQLGWPRAPFEDRLKPFHQCHTELSINDGCILRGTRLVIPQSLRSQVMEELHQGHIGVVKMKSTARNYVWWPDLDKDIEGLAQACPECNAVRNKPPSITHHWEPAELPWQRVHLDFAGPVDGHMFLLAIDAHSKWPEVFPMKSTTASATITILRSLFARQGLPVVIVSDNGPQFTSEEFNQFLKRNGVKHVTSAPYHPQSNGQVERLVHTFKQSYKANSGSCEQKVDQFLMKYRTTIHSTTGRTPSDLLYGRTIRTRLDFLRPSPTHTVPEAVQSRFKSGQTVWYQDYKLPARRWLPGLIIELIGNCMFWVQDDQEPHVQVRRHQDQLHPRSTLPYRRDVDRNLGNTVPSIPCNSVPISPDSQQTYNPADVEPAAAAEPLTDQGGLNDTPTVTSKSPTEVRRSTRASHPPSYLEDYVSR